MAPVKASRRTKTKDRKARKTSARTKSGVTVTSDVSDALAREAERGYDLSKAKRRRAGRPSLGNAGASPRVTFRAGPELYRAARARARREGRTISDLAREAVARYVRECESHSSCG